MKRTTTVTLTGPVLLLLSLTCPASGEPANGAAPAREPDTAAASPQPTQADTIRAHRSLDVPDMPADDVFREMVRRAAAEHAAVLGVPADEADRIIVFTPHASGGLFGSRGSSSADRLSLSLDLRRVEAAATPEPRAADFLDGIVGSLASQLREWHAERLGVPQADEAVRVAEAAAAEQRAKLRESEDVIRRLTGRADASVEAIRAALPKLDEERQTLKLQVIGKEARQKALAETIERLAKAASERAQDDPVAAELQKVVDAREAALRGLEKLRESQAGSAADVTEAQAVLAEARARMLERRDSVAQSSGGELLDTLNRELASLSIDAAEAQAKLAALDTLLKKYVEAHDPLAQADDARRRLQAADRALDLATEHRARARGLIPSVVLRVIQSESLGPEEARVQEEQEQADQREHGRERERDGE